MMWLFKPQKTEISQFISQFLVVFQVCWVLRSVTNVRETTCKKQWFHYCDASCVAWKRPELSWCCIFSTSLTLYLVYLGFICKRFLEWIQAQQFVVRRTRVSTCEPHLQHWLWRRSTWPAQSQGLLSRPGTRRLLAPYCTTLDRPESGLLQLLVQVLTPY